MVQWSQQKPHPVVSAQQLNVVLGHGVYHQVVQTTGTQNLNSVGMWMMHSIPGVRTCWWFSMSLGAKITILCYTFGLNRVHQVPLVYHHFPHWNWSLKVRLIFLDKLMFFPRGLFEAFFLCVYVCVCLAAVYIKPPTYATRNLHQFKCFHRLLRVSSPSAVSSPDADQWEASFHSDMFPIYWIVISIITAIIYWEHITNII